MANRVALTFGLLFLACASSTAALAQQQKDVPPLTPEEIEALRKATNDRQAAQYATPEEIEAIRRKELDKDQAMGVTGYTNGTMRNLTSRTINIVGSGKGQPYPPQTLTLWSDTVSSVSFFDSTGEAWPVDSVSFDTRAMRVNNEGCETKGNGGGAARFEGVGNVLTVMPCSFWTVSSMQILLNGETRPLLFDLRSGSTDETPDVDAAVTVNVSSDVDSPYGKSRAGVLANDWINPNARAIRIDPIDTKQDKTVTPIIIGPGVTTDVSFMDGTKQPWPIEEIVFPPGVVAINGPCAKESDGLQRLAGGDATTLYMTSCADHRATIGIKLKGRAGALSLMTVPAIAHTQQPDGTVSVTVPGVSPLEVKQTAVSASAPGGGSAAGYGAYNHDRFLDDFLAGSPPQGARRATITGGSGLAEGWYFNGALYLRGSFEIMNPAYDAGGSSSDGSFKVFKYEPPVSRILASDLRGREFVLNIQQ